MRKFHRWISVVAALFLVVVGTTGVVLQVQRLVGGEEEQEREREAATESEAARGLIRQSCCRARLQRHSSVRRAGRWRPLSSFQAVMSRKAW